MAITTVDNNRRDPVLKRSDVKTTLPEWFQADNPKFIRFMEVYEEFLDSDQGKFNFHQKVQDIFWRRPSASGAPPYVRDVLEVNKLGCMSKVSEVL